MATAATEEMQCEGVGCEFKTPPMGLAMAMQRLELHYKIVHLAAQVVSQPQPQGDQPKLNQTKLGDLSLRRESQRISSYIIRDSGLGIREPLG